MIVGIDMGGHHLSAGEYKDGAVVKRLTVTTPSSRTPGEVLEKLRHLVGSLCDNRSLEAVGIGLPGMLSPDRERILSLTNQFGWENYPIRAELEKTFHVPVAIGNDCDCAGMGEMMAGAGKKLNSFVFFSLGTGIGGAVIIDRHLVAGAHRMGGEIGHIPVLCDAPCTCGGRGHVESFFSADRFEEAGRRNGWPVDVREQWPHYEEPFLAPVWGRALTALACGIAATIVTIDPEAVVIGGGLSNLPNLLDELSDYVRPLLPTAFKPYLTLLRAELGPDAAIIGSASLAQEKLSHTGKL